METIRKLAEHRRPTAWARRLLASVLAAGAAAVGHAQEPAVSVEPPRAPMQAPPPSPLSVLPDAAQAAAFHVAPIAGQPQPLPPGNVPTDGTTAPPINYGNWPPVNTAGPQYLAMPAPSAAPAWRWHGYGGVVPTEVGQPEAATGGSKPAAPAPQNKAVDGPRSPTTELNMPLPVFGAPTDPVPSPLPAAPGPLSAAEPRWRSGIQPAAYVQSNPMTAGPAPWCAVPSTPVVAVTDERQQPAVTLDAPRIAGTYISRAVSDAAVQPASYSPPPPAKPRTPAVLPSVRVSIERACAGRVRDVEIISRGPANILVRLKVRQPADAEYIANVVSRLPELGPYQVLFEMQVVR